MVHIFVPKPIVRTHTKIFDPEEAGAWKDGRGRWHYTLDNEPAITVTKPLPVKCYRCHKPHVFVKSGSMLGWRPPSEKHPVWLCPRC